MSGTEAELPPAIVTAKPVSDPGNKTEPPVPVSGSAQWIRKVKLIVAEDGGHALDLSEMRIVFTVQQSTIQTPNQARIRVYNLSEETTQRVQLEFTKVILQAGYTANLGNIFAGEIRQVRRGRESATDTYLEIIAGDGDRPYVWGTVNFSLAAGATHRDVIEAVVKELKPYGVTLGYLPPLPETRAVRGQAFSGMARDVLREIAAELDMTWYIENGQIIFLPKNGYIPGEAVVLNSASGLIGMPEQTIGGIEARCLLNPRIHVGRLVHINNRDINEGRISLARTDGAAFGNHLLLHGEARIADDGFYRVLCADHIGD
ncbi:MAG: hypothetical protein QJR07_15605, partial [Acetobacteraceae bacterium]|nr:hypothetical protein [Acetobacteraceae bacterium]